MPFARNDEREEQSVGRASLKDVGESQVWEPEGANPVYQSVSCWLKAPFRSLD